MDVDLRDLLDEDLRELADAYRRTALDPAVRARLRAWCVRMAQAMVREHDRRRGALAALDLEMDNALDEAGDPTAGGPDAGEVGGFAAAGTDPVAEALEELRRAAREGAAGQDDGREA